MDIHIKSVDMDMDVKFHIHGNPAQSTRVTDRYTDKITSAKTVLVYLVAR